MAIHLAGGGDVFNDVLFYAVLSHEMSGMRSVPDNFLTYSYFKVFYVMGKALSGKLCCMWIGLLSISFTVNFFFVTFISKILKYDLLVLNQV